MKFYEKIFCAVVALLGILGLAPYFVWSSARITHVTDVVALALLIFVIFKKKAVTTKRKIIYTCTFVLFYLYYIFPGYTGNVNINLTFVFVFVILLLSTEYQKHIFQYFSLFFAISLIPSILLFVINMVGIPIENLPYNIIEPMGGIKSLQGAYYREYFGALIYRGDPKLAGIPPHQLYRICGIYDEPGLVGTIGGLILTVSGFNLRDKKNIVILIAGVLTFSLAFFMMLAINLAVHIKPKITIPIVLAVIIFLLTPFAQNNELLQKQVYQRFDLERESILVNNRESTAFKVEFDKYIKNASAEELAFGRGYSSNINNIVNRRFADVSSWRQYFYDQGILGSAMLLFVIGLYCCWFCKKKDLKRTLSFLAVFALSFYQRPNIFIIPYMIIFFCGLACENGFYISVVSKKNAERLIAWINGAWNNIVLKGLRPRVSERQCVREEVRWGSAPNPVGGRSPPGPSAGTPPRA